LIEVNERLQYEVQLPFNRHAFYGRSGRSTEIRADHANGSLLITPAAQ